MTLLDTSLLLALLNFPSLSTSQQTAIITELPAYSSLSPCAASVVSSAALQFSNLWCSPTTSPVALASCICLIPLSSAAVSDEISLDAYVTCTEGGSSDLKSALSVLTTYCAAVSQADGSPLTTKTTTGGTFTNTANSASSTLSAAAGSISIDTAFPGTSTSGLVGNSPSSSLSNPSSSPTQAGSGGGLSSSDKITIGLSIGIGLPATIAAIISAYFAYLWYLSEKRKKVGRAEETRVTEAESGVELRPLD